MSQPHDFPFDITDVAELLHLRIRRPSPQGFYVDCPICNDKRGKMHINTQTDTWRCNYCDESGGMLALYAKVHSISTSAAYREISDALLNGVNLSDHAVKYPDKPKETPAEAAPVADIAVRHKTYTALLAMLTLSKEHRAHLQTVRGLPDEQIERLGYKSTLTDQRIPYMRDKTADERYFILTLFAVAFELAGTEYRKDEIVDVQLAVGLPPAHYGAQYERFENYFLNRDIIDFQLDGRPYSVFISTAICFPQAYAAIMPIYQRIHSYSKVAVLDIGGFTADYLLVKNGEADLSACDSLDNGVITLYNGIKSKVNADFDILLDESDIDAILKDTPTDFDESVIRIVQEQAQQFINDLFGKLRERMIDLRSGKAVFVGGGSILLKKQIEASGKVGAPIFVDEISANTKGYELLFKAACMG